MFGRLDGDGHPRALGGDLAHQSFRYRLVHQAVDRGTEDENRLFAEMKGQGEAEIFCEVDDKFFMRSAPVSLSFERDSTGVVTHVKLSFDKKVFRLAKKK